ncbi:33398_t:CDS:1, partial [Racocetra persica]
MKAIKMRKHPDILDVFPSQKKRKSSDNLNSYLQYLIQSHNLIRMILSCTLPLSIVNNNEFRQFCSSLDSRFILLNSETIRNTIINAYDRTNKLIQNKIIETAEFVALTLDIWSHSYFEITCHWITYDFKLIEVVLEVMNFSGSELFEKHQLTKFRLAHKNIVSITVNNEDNGNVKTALSQMQFEIIPCLANILRISVDS